MKELITFCLICLTLVACSVSQESSFDIVEENGFKVVADEDPERSTIICTLDSLSNHGLSSDEHTDLACVNNYDSSDVVFLDNMEDFHEEETVSVTFFHDDVESVKIFK
ncbi:hypothetical protein [Halobacillus litoralis]|uniref:hypothetical protein n=1 Tax=Halobacillus litoralis TaxID=45668 RepID=UPI001CD41ED6|nr:hypothetical protein [Halobacillus litoralis]MCA1021611.1 hypothetical protein [Halobacillus litoralis]